MDYDDNELVPKRRIKSKRSKRVSDLCDEEASDNAQTKNSNSKKKKNDKKKTKGTYGCKKMKQRRAVKMTATMVVVAKIRIIVGLAKGREVRTVTILRGRKKVRKSGQTRHMSQS